MKIYFLLILLFNFIYSNTYFDNDNDGVNDNIDKCLNTQFLDIVNKEGCSKNQLKVTYSFQNTISSTKINDISLITYNLSLFSKYKTHAFYFSTGKYTYDSILYNLSNTLGYEYDYIINDNMISFDVNIVFSNDSSNNYNFSINYQKNINNISAFISNMYDYNSKYYDYNIGLEYFNNNFTYTFKYANSYDNSISLILRYDFESKINISYEYEDIINNTTSESIHYITLGYEF